MKDLDTKTLSEIYDMSINSKHYESKLINENISEFSEYLTEDIVSVLGQTLASRIIGLVKRDIPTCTEGPCLQRLENMAEGIINNIEMHVRSPMITRTLNDYKGLPAVTKVKVIYQLLSTVN